MTKIKNTKKGMAKKTLSMSLVVAMLATSNVPVWANEFSTGEDVTEFSSEAETPDTQTITDDSEAPVVEDADNNVEAASVGLAGLTLSAGDKVNKNEVAKVTADIDASVKASLNAAPVATTSGNVTLVVLTWSTANGRVTATTDMWSNTDTITIPSSIVNSAKGVGKIISVKASFETRTYTDGTHYSIVSTSDAETKELKTIGETIEDYKNSKKLEFDTTETKVAYGTNLKLKSFAVYNHAVTTYKWFADKAEIKGETETSYTPTADMIGKTITAQVTITHPDLPGEKTTVTTETGITVKDSDTLTSVTEENKQGYAIDWDMTGSEKTTWPEYTYTGDEFRPSIKKITKAGKEYNSSDYQLSWNNNTNAGTASVVVTFTADAIAKDTDLPKRLSIAFTIKQADFTKATVTASKTPSYASADDTAAAVHAAGITVTLGGKTLTEYETNLNPKGQYEIDAATTLSTVGTGTGKIVIKPHDTTNYTGTVTLTTDVTRKDINELYIEDIADKDFIGTEIKPTLTVKYNKDASQSISASSNYEVTYSDNILSGTATAHIKGINNYTGERDITFKIKAADKSFETALKDLIGNASVGYTGSEISYVKSAYVDSKGTLYAINRDFTVKYLTQHTNAGKCRVEVSGAGVYAGQSFTVDFEITPKDISGFKQNTSTAFGKEITVADMTYDPATSSYKPEVTITYNGTTLSKDVDYEVEYGTVNNRIVPITIKGKGNFQGTVSATGKIVAKDIKTVTFEEIAQQKYDKDGVVAGPNTFTIKAKDGNTNLKEGTDFHVVKYDNNKKPGVATITIAGLGNYQGETTLTFLIVDREYTASIVKTNGSTLLDAVTYDRAKATATVNGVKGMTLSKGTDFTVVDNSTGEVIDVNNYNVTYENNTEAGTATIKVEGKDGYKISAINTFEIKPATLPRGTSISDISSQIYTGSEIKPTVTITSTDGTYKLVEGTDYEVSYEKNTDVGTAKVVVTGKGNYAGLNADKTVNHVDKAFAITKASISRSEIAVNDVAYAGGIEVTPVLKVVNPISGKELVKDTDYTITLKDGVNVGVATVTIKLTDNAKKNYDLVSGAETATFHIIKKALADCDVAVAKEKDGSLTATVMNGVVKETAEKFETKDNGDGTATVSVVDGGKNYTGTVTVPVADNGEGKVGQAMISEVRVSGNTVTPVLSGDVDGAVGYDYVIATEEDYENGRVDISKNVLKTNTNFYYVQEGTYYAYCHAWKRDENGKKVFGAWSNLKKFEVTATTPSTPKITSVKVSGSTVTVTYTKSTDATGYDVVLGSSVKKVNNEKRPVDYGTLVKKNVNGNTVTVTFKNVKKGTYYAGLHSFNRTSENGSKVFSKWSNTKTVTVK